VVNLYLIGYRGCGKTTVARRLSQRTGRPWIDADDLLERTAGQSIADIFATAGEARFRDLEAQCLAQISQQQGQIAALGGGVILREANRERLLTGHTVWLTVSPETAWERIEQDRTTGARRPNLSNGGLDEVQEMLARREPLYRECAEIIIATEGKLPAAVAEEILSQAAARGWELTGKDSSC